MSDRFPIDGITLPKLAEYVRDLPGWTVISRSPQFQIFAGGTAENPIELALPIATRTKDMRSRIHDAIELLAAAQDSNYIAVAQEILSIDRDILLERLPVENVASIPLKMAAQAVLKLRNLVATGTALEFNIHPFKAGHSKQSEAMVERCQFGHTFRGSFGFTLEMPIPERERDNTGTVIPHMPKPLERRVMERIVRGIKATQRAVREDNPDILVGGYENGFNASMLKQILDFKEQFPEHNPSYTVRWAPRQEVTTDVQNAVDLSISRNSTQLRRVTDVLSTAIKELKHREDTSLVTIVGFAEALKKDIDAEELVGDGESGISRVVTIVGKLATDLETQTKDMRIRVKLNLPDYSAACDAHKLNRKVSVKGRIVRDSNSLTLAEPQEFHLL